MEKAREGTGVKRTLAGFSFVAAVLALLSPWTAASPFSAPLSLWVIKFLAPLFGGGMSTVFMKFSPLVIVFPLIGSIISAIPFLDLRRVVSNSCLNPYLTGVTIGVFLVGIGGALELALTRSTAWDPWRVVELTLVVLFGFLLIRCGSAMMRIPQPPFTSGRFLGWFTLVIGVCFFSFVLLPVGVLGMVTLYFKLGLTFLHLPQTRSLSEER